MRGSGPFVGAADGKAESGAGGGAGMFGPETIWWFCAVNAAQALSWWLARLVRTWLLFYADESNCQKETGELW